MAGTITATTTLAVTNGSYTPPQISETMTITQSSQGGVNDVQAIGTSEETVTVGDVGTLGVMWVKNCDDTNYVQTGPDSTGMVAFMRVLAGEWAGPFRLEPGITIKAQANTASVNLWKVITES